MAARYVSRSCLAVLISFIFSGGELIWSCLRRLGGFLSRTSITLRLPSTLHRFRQFPLPPATSEARDHSARRRFQPGCDTNAPQSFAAIPHPEFHGCFRWQLHLFSSVNGPGTRAYRFLCPHATGSLANRQHPKWICTGCHGTSPNKPHLPIPLADCSAWLNPSTSPDTRQWSSPNPFDPFLRGYIEPSFISAQSPPGDRNKLNRAIRLHKSGFLLVWFPREIACSRGLDPKLDPGCQNCSRSNRNPADGRDALCTASRASFYEFVGNEFWGEPIRLVRHGRQCLAMV